jgi:hypothetical protein
MRHFHIIVIMLLTVVALEFGMSERRDAHLVCDLRPWPPDEREKLRRQHRHGRGRDAAGPRSETVANIIDEDFPCGRFAAP